MEQEYGFDRLDAYTLVGQVGESTVANIVDPAYSVVAKIRTVPGGAMTDGAAAAQVDSTGHGRRSVASNT